LKYIQKRTEVTKIEETVRSHPSKFRSRPTIWAYLLCNTVYIKGKIWSNSENTKYSKPAVSI